MEIQTIKNIIEAILFSAGRVVSNQELMLALELPIEEIDTIIQSMKEDYKTRGIELIKVDDGYQLCSKKEYYEYICQILDKRNKPRLSGASLEVLAIIAYNEKITRAEIEAIRGVNCDASVYKLLEYGLIEEAGKIDAPGKPMTYRTTKDFLKLFGLESLDNLPELPRYKMDENKQIVIDDILNDGEAEVEKPVPQEEAVEEKIENDEGEN